MQLEPNRVSWSLGLLLGGGALIGVILMALAPVERTKELPGGYALFRDEDRRCMILDESSGVVIPSMPSREDARWIVGVAVMDDLVVGHVEGYGYGAGGYFILDTANREAVERMTRPAFERECSARLGRVPRLKGP